MLEHNVNKRVENWQKVMELSLEIPKYENPIEYKGLIKTETKNDTLIVYSYN